MLYFFFFKQKTAYEMRISDWSSDVCSSDLRVRLRMLVRDAGAPDEHVRAGPVAPVERIHRYALGYCRLAPGGIVVPRGNRCARTTECAGRRETRAREAHDRHRPALQVSGKDHRHLSFSVARPMTASTEAIIQKRMTMVGSCQPFCSK